MGAITLLHAESSEIGFPLITVYSSSEVGGDAQTYSSAQGDDGSLFFGGNELLIFDGERWNSVPMTAGYGLRHLTFGRDRRLWAGGVGDLGWFEPGPNHAWQFRSLLENLPEGIDSAGEVFRVFPNGHGALFVTKNRIHRWDGTRFEEWEMPNSHRLLASEANGTVYVDQFPYGVYAIRGTERQLFLSPETLGENGMVWLVPLTSDWLLTTNDGLFLLHDKIATPFAREVSDFLRDGKPVCGTRLLDGRYAFGTLKKGIVLMRPNGDLDTVIAESDGLPINWITSLCVDRDGQLWATSRSNIFRIDLAPETAFFDQRAGLPPQAYRSIAKVGDTIMIASESGIYALSSVERSTAWRLVDGPAHHVARFGDAVWGAGFHSVTKMRDESAETVYVADRDVYAIGASKLVPGRYYLSEPEKITELTDDGVTREVVRRLPDFARSIVEDERGNLWMSTIARGVFRAQLEEDGPVDAKRVDGSSGLPLLRGRSFVRATADGAILVFAGNGGWLKPVGETLFRPIENYPKREITAASEFNADGTGWVVHPESGPRAPCAARIAIRGTEARWEPHSIPGLPSIGSPRSVFVEATATQAINLWIGGTKSVLRTAVNHGPLAPAPRAPLLHGFAQSEDGQALQLTTGKLPYSSEIQFEFAAPEFFRRSSLRLETRIDGIDSDWRPAAPSSRHALGAVRDGNFTFRLRAVAETGATSEETKLHFQVLPPWWRSPLVLFGYVLALLPIGYFTYRFRLRTLERRNMALEAKVARRTKELQEASAAKTQFVANMSHDIRNPLNGIMGLALALEDSKLDRRQREMVATLRECSTYLSSLVEDVLDFASIEAGRVELRPGPFIPQELLRSVVNTLKADANQRGALLLVEADPELPANVVGDAGRIQQILVNFVSNALKYAGGTIRLSVGTPVEAAHEIEFAVTDEGPGISEDEQRALFTKFTRLKRAGDIPGTGLGLASCRLLADLMGGSVGLESRMGAGSRFFLRLPLAIATAPVESQVAQLPNITVLVVEDTDYNAWAAEAVLAKLGLSCERARTGTEALELFGKKRYNVVLLDRNLPDMDGTQVAKRMREMETEGPRSVLFAVTAYCTAEDRALCLEAGMDAFVGKPLTPEKLRKALRDAGRSTLPATNLQASVDSTPPLPVPAPARELDVSLLKFLSDGSAQGFEEQMRKFLDEFHQCETQLSDSYRTRDYRKMQKDAHRLLGQARMIGGAALVEACASLEAAACSHDQDRCEELLGLVWSEADALKAAMHRQGPAAPSA